MGNSSTDLDRLLLDAHRRDDASALAALYAEAATECEKRDDISAACFYLTHAYVFALQAGAEESTALQMRLWRYGRETKPPQI